MKVKGLIFILAAVIVVISTGNYSSVHAVDWRFPLGLTYVSNVDDIVDINKKYTEAETGVKETTSFVSPVGLSFHPYVQFDFGLGIGAGIGPTMICLLQESSFINVPLKLDVRYSIPRLIVSPYVRAGLSYHAAFGDYVESSTPGVFGAIGVEFLRTKKVGFGLELSADQAEIEFETTVRNRHSYSYYSPYWGWDTVDYYTEDKVSEKIKPCEFTASLYVVF